MSELHFSHRDHLRLAWDVIERRGRSAAPVAIAEALRLLAAVHGQPLKYNETLTLFWVRLVLHVRQARPDVLSFDAMLTEMPVLLDPQLPYRHWTREALFSDAARAGWTEPDLRPIPI